MATPGESLLASAARRAEPWAAATQPFTFAPRRDSDRRESWPVHVREVPAAFTASAAPSTIERSAREQESVAPHSFLQVANTYLVRALDDGFEILDQHALHERITFEALKRDVAAGALEVQRFLVPEWSSSRARKSRWPRSTPTRSRESA
jgi:DNA mismatch repair ATPase MutL